MGIFVAGQCHLESLGFLVSDIKVYLNLKPEQNSNTKKTLKEASFLLSTHFWASSQCQDFAPTYKSL